MQSLIIAQCGISSYKIDFQQPFSFAGNTLTQREGFYVLLKSDSGLSAQGEIAPLPGLSEETFRRAQHDLKEVCLYLNKLEVPADKDALIAFLRQDQHMRNCCSSVRFGVESAVMGLAAKAAGQTLVEFLGSHLKNVPTAALLQGPHAQVLADAKRMSAAGYKVFKLKVGDRNIALDVKKVQDLRAILDEGGAIRLDGNKVWSLKEALIFAELVGNAHIEYIEEPLSNPADLNQFYSKTHMPVALDETLSVLRCGVQAPGRCSPTLANHEGVKVFVLKPTIVGGLIATLDWINEAKSLGKKAVISSSFESEVGLKILVQLACLTDTVAGLGTERWLKGSKPLVNESGIILQ